MKTTVIHLLLASVPTYAVYESSMTVPVPSLPSVSTEPSLIARAEGAHVQPLHVEHVTPHDTWREAREVPVVAQAHGPLQAEPIERTPPSPARLEPSPCTRAAQLTWIPAEAPRA